MGGGTLIEAHELCQRADGGNIKPKIEFSSVYAKYTLCGCVGMAPTGLYIVTKVEKSPPAASFENLSPVETAEYTGDLLESLRKTASRQGQTLLAHLLGLAVAEARFQASAQAQDTRLPG